MWYPPICQRKNNKSFESYPNNENNLFSWEVTHEMKMEKFSRKAPHSWPEIRKEPFFLSRYSGNSTGKIFQKCSSLMTRNQKFWKKSGKIFQETLWVTTRFLEIFSRICQYGLRKLKDCFVQFSSATQWRLVTTISRTKRSFGVILAVFGNFCKTETAHIGAISWVDIGSVQPALSILKKLARWHPIQKSYSIFHIHGNIATYRVFILMTVRKNHLKPVISLYFIYFNRFFEQKKS